MAETPTGLLRRLDPKWAWVRENVTFGKAIWLGTAMIALVYGWADIRHNVAQLQTDVTKLTEIVQHQPDHAAELAALRQQVADLQAQVEAQGRKWERVDQYADMRVKRR